MKTYNTFTLLKKLSLLVALLFTMASCSDDEPVYKLKYLLLQLNVGSEGYEGSVELKGLDTYIARAETDVDWVSLKRELYESGTPTYYLQVKPNDNLEERNAGITFTSAKGDVLFYTIIQAPYVPVLTDESHELGYEAWTSTIVLENFSSAVADIEGLPNWIRLTTQQAVDGKPAYRIAVTENTSPAPRDATFTITSTKSDKHTVVITQAGKPTDGTGSSNDEVSTHPAYMPHK